MSVLLIRSDLPESPEVLLLAGVLGRDRDLGWVPSPSEIVARLIKIWAWVAEHGYQDSDSCDYRIPSAIVASLESQLDCPGLLVAMCDPRVDWCRDDGDHWSFCRFAEWNGESAMKRRGDATRAKRSRSRSQLRMSRTETTPKAHAKRDARHKIDKKDAYVYVNVNDSLETNKKTYTSTYQPPEDERLVMAAFESIRLAVRSQHGADQAQVDKDRETAYKTAVIVVQRLGGEWLTRVLETLGKTKPRRPYGYLAAAVTRRLDQDGQSAREAYAKIDVPAGLVDPAGVVTHADPPASAAAKPIDLEKQRTDRRAAVRRKLLDSGLSGDEFTAAFDSQCEALGI